MVLFEHLDTVLLEFRCILGSFFFFFSFFPPTVEFLSLEIVLADSVAQLTSQFGN